MASARSSAIDKVLSLGHSCSFSTVGMLLVATTRSNDELLILWTAGPDRTAWVHAAEIDRAPFAINASVVWMSVPAVSMMSSTTNTLRPSTSPMMFMTSVWFAATRRLSMMASVAPEPLRVGAGALHAAGVGRDDRQVGGFEVAQIANDHRRREEVVDRDVEETLDLRGVQVDREHAVGAGRGDQVGHQLRGDRHARLVLAVLPRVAVVREHGGDAAADARLNASIMMSSSIRLSFTGGEVGCMTKTSAPRTFSSICT